MAKRNRGAGRGGVGMDARRPGKMVRLSEVEQNASGRQRRGQISGGPADRVLNNISKQF